MCSVAEPPDASELIKILVEKSMKPWIFDNFHELWEHFLFKKLILIIIKVSVMGYWNYL